MRRLFGILVLLLVIITCGATLASRNPSLSLENIRYYSYPEYTRVVLDLSASLKISEHLLRQPEWERMFFDLKNCRFAKDYPEYKKKEIPISSGNLKGIRIGQRSRGTIRVVFDFDRIGRYNRFYLTSPFRIVFDIYKENQGRAVSVSAPPVADPPPAKPSIARQLGLGVRRIILDPGHGGKDPGAVNPQMKLEEKEITLDIAKRLKAMLSEHYQFETLLTREKDEYLSLEERTAIANSANGDLFLSIHVNSAPKKNVRGIESYFLSLTTDPWAMSVAAQENAMSTKSIAELRTILDKIVKDSVIAESKILSQYLQKNLLGFVRKKYIQVPDLGVKKAPFYVLIGAHMPASLVELSFMSSKEEGTLLKSGEYRHTLAGGLYLGITSFIESLRSR